ncbi:MAG TPA: helix-turn-helix transcriptional regulator [Candidatus Binatia bacterium]|nr:helix-turn-helix transcriptional regulator [Candidatus Binatia bacterium]
MPQDSKDIDWREWMRAFGRQERRVREFLGMSQEQLARMAGVSQGAVSRLEAGRGLATPMLVVLKINLALRAALRDVDPALLSDDLRRVLEIEERISPRVGDLGIGAAPVTKDPALEGVVRLYRGVPERQRDTFLSVVRAAAEALSSQDGAPDERSSKHSG